MKLSRVVFLGILVGMLSSIAFSQRVLNTSVSLADGSTLTISAVQTGQYASSGDAYDIYMQLGDIKGESQQPDHKDWVELVVWPSTGSQSRAQLVAGLLGATALLGGGSPDDVTTVLKSAKTFTEIKILKVVDKTSPVIMQSIGTTVLGLSQLLAGRDDTTASDIFTKLGLQNTCPGPILDTP
ncbi:MAG TPA: type VI secretion system tube protein Hcp [Terriglobales bacterium]|nr:type VI secretion system tube protein Hcp [Terriglobales bacterium]